MNTPKKTTTLLFNPFFYVAGGKALGLGLGAVLLAALIGSLGKVHFDGVLDTHAGAWAPAWVFFAEGLIDWLSLAVVLWVAGKIISKSAFRAIDVFGTQALARWPMVFVALAAALPAFQNASNRLVTSALQGSLSVGVADVAILCGGFVFMAFLVCWTVLLMYRGFSVACNVKGGKAIGVFMVGLIVAEVISKLCLAPILQKTVLPAAFNPSAAATNQPAAATLPSGPANPAMERGAQFVALLVKADFAGATGWFDETMKRVMPEESLRNSWRELIKQAGPFQKQLHAGLVKQSGYDVVIVHCQFEQARVDIKVVFDSKERVAGLFYLPAQQPESPRDTKGK